MSKELKRTEINPTEKIIVPEEKDTLEQELRSMTKEQLIDRLNYEETDPKVIKLIKKIIKEK